MRAVNEFLTKWASYFFAMGAIALAGFFVHQGQADAIQDEKLREQESQISLLRKENREDHRTIEARLNELLKRP